MASLSVTDVATAPATKVAVTCPVTTLAPAQSTTCTATYVVAQADVDTGSVHDSATAAGTGPSEEPVGSEPSAATVSIVRGTGLSLTKSATPATLTEIGEQVGYTFVVTNTGNVTLTGVAVSDAVTAPGQPVTVGCPSTSVLPMVSMTCTATTAATSADFDAGSIVNSASASGQSPVGPVTSDPVTATVSLTPRPALTLTNTADPDSVTAAGQVVSYRFLVTNTGNVTVTGLAVAGTGFAVAGTGFAVAGTGFAVAGTGFAVPGTGFSVAGTRIALAEGLTAVAGPEPTMTCPATTLAAGDSMACSASYTVTQADVDEGQLRFSAVASGSAPCPLPAAARSVRWTHPSRWRR